MTPPSPLGPRLLAAHQAAVDGFLAALGAVPDERWSVPPAPGRWSAAALTLHVIDAYRHCLQALAGGRQMRRRLPAWRMWMLRELVLPVMFRLGRFPREAPAPPEVIPDLTAAEALSPAQARAQLVDAAARTVAALEAAAALRPSPRLDHAYFGAMSPRQTLMLLAGHTRHHAGGLRNRSRSTS